jgi:hypothetical protein
MLRKVPYSFVGLDERCCRTCGHEHWRKIDIKDITPEDLEEITESRMPWAHCKNWNEGCRCRKWLPLDNLEYLERKYETKQKSKS